MMEGLGKYIHILDLDFINDYLLKQTPKNKLPSFDVSLYPSVPPFLIASFDLSTTCREQYHSTKVG